MYNTKKTYRKRMHAFKKPLLCKGLTCNMEFTPKRKDQVFCSPDCRMKYFDIARRIGIIFIRGIITIKPDMVREFIEILRRAKEKQIPEE